jgi:hypothetical protein
MSTEKKNIKVRDLKPSKDAKGGGVSRAGASHEGASHQGASHNSHGTEGASRNSKHRLSGGGGHR